MKRAWMLAGALACLAGVPEQVPAAEPVAGPAIDVAARWEHFLATVELGDALNAYAVLPAISYDGGNVDAGRCREKAKDIAASIQKVPVSIALHRADYLCAKAVGDAAAMDRALAELAALSRFALRDTGEYLVARPIRVVTSADAIALVRSAGLEDIYGYYPQRNPTRYFPLVIAAREPGTTVERHLAFDYIDAQFHLAHKDPYSGFPVERIALVKGYIQPDTNITESLDRLAVNDALDGPGDHAVATLRGLAERGGTEAAKEWLTLCEGSRDRHCADGLVDALLPQAEKQYAYPMVLLSLAYLDGVGIAKDPKAAWALLDGADRHWRNGGAYERFARIWYDLHGSAKPPELVSRLAEAAKKNGNRFLARIRITEKVDANAELTKEDIAFLADPAENHVGFGYAVLAAYEGGHNRLQEKLRWLVKAAEAGDADSMAEYGFDLMEGDDGVAVDEAKGRRLLEDAAQAGSPNAGRYLGWAANRDGKWSESEMWLLMPGAVGDTKAALFLADLYENERPGVSGKLDRAVEIYRDLADKDSAEARRNLARLAIEGRGMAKDPMQARKWLQQDAEKNDPDSMVQLGAGYATGDFGAVDMKEAIRWMERAMATGNASARDEYASLLYHRVGTPEARVRAFSLWQESADHDDDEGRNNLAWALCTSAYPEELDSRRGLALAKAMGKPEKLQAAYLDTLAACHAAAGEYERGAALQQQVFQQVERQTNGMASAERASRLKAFQERLDLYRARKPYRVPAPAPAAQSDASKPNSSVSLTSSPTK